MNPFSVDQIANRTIEELQQRLKKLQHRDLSRYKTLTWERARIRAELRNRL